MPVDPQHYDDATVGATFKPASAEPSIQQSFAP
jgi:hypothetical protein